MTNHISSLIPSQLPAYIREEYPTFVKFIEAYYEYLELEKNPNDVLAKLRQYADIDETLDEFVDVFHQQYLSTLPTEIAADKRLVAKHIQDLYKSKGTEKSYQLLFRILFNEDVELYYPKTNILKASDGKWVQEQSLQIQPLSGDVFSLVGSTIRVQTSTGLIATLVNDVKVITPGKLYEVFISNNYRGTFELGNTVVGTAFRGKIMPTITGFTIFNPGKKFRLGQIYEITSGGGKGTLVKITRVDTNGGVTGLSIMSFGSGYESDFYASLNNAVPLSGATSPYEDYTNGYVESGFITKATYFATDFSTPDYAATVVGQFGGNMYVPDKSSYNNTESCVLLMKLGPLAKYPGYYKTTDGFLSDANALHDGVFYQEYSYVVRSKRRLDEYKKIVKEVIHPAGMKLIGEYQIVNELELGDFLEYDKVVLKTLANMDVATAADAIAIATSRTVGEDTASLIDSLSKQVGKGLDDGSGTNDNVTLSFGKVNTDIANTTDGLVFAVVKVIADIVNTASSISASSANGLTDAPQMADAVALTSGKRATSVTDLADSTSFMMTKVLSDAVDAISDPDVFSGKQYIETPGADDDIAIGVGKAVAPDLIDIGDFAPVLNIGKSLLDEIEHADTGSILLADYADDFVSIDYANSTIRTF